jgi:hypothetical protein
VKRCWLKGKYILYYPCNVLHKCWIFSALLCLLILPFTFSLSTLSACPIKLYICAYTYVYSCMCD